MKDDFNEDNFNKDDLNNSEDEVLDELFEEDDEESFDEAYGQNYGGVGENGESSSEENGNWEDSGSDASDSVNSGYRGVGNLKKKIRKPNKSKKLSLKGILNPLTLKVLASSLAGCVLVFGLMLSNKYELFSQGKVGIEAVELLYDFNNINELANNLKDLKKMMTTKCYYKTTVLNSEKSLNTYLKFKKKSTKVNIIDSKPGFVLYSLDNEYITDSRIFIFSYRLNLFGDICEVREFEAIDFYSELQSVSDEELDKLIEQWESEGEPEADEIPSTEQNDDIEGYSVEDGDYIDEEGQQRLEGESN